MLYILCEPKLINANIDIDANDINDHVAMILYSYTSVVPLFILPH